MNHGTFLEAELQLCEWISTITSGDSEEQLYVGTFATEAEAEEAAVKAAEEYNKATDAPDLHLSEVYTSVFPMVNWKTRMEAQIDKQRAERK